MPLLCHIRSARYSIVVPVETVFPFVFLLVIVIGCLPMLGITLGCRQCRSLGSSIEIGLGFGFGLELESVFVFVFDGEIAAEISGRVEHIRLFRTTRPTPTTTTTAATHALGITWPICRTWRSGAVIVPLATDTDININIDVDVGTDTDININIRPLIAAVVSPSRLPPLLQIRAVFMIRSFCTCTFTGGGAASAASAVSSVVLSGGSGLCHCVHRSPDAMQMTQLSSPPTTTTTASAAPRVHL